MDDAKLSKLSIPQDILQSLFIASNSSTLEIALERLIKIARETDGRTQLASKNILTIVLQLCQCVSDPSCRHILLLSLKLLRNLCAGEMINQNSFIEQSGVGIVNSIIVSANRSSSDFEMVRIGLQILGNVSLAGKEHQHAVWHDLFMPDIVEISQIRQRGTCDPLCMILYTCLEVNLEFLSDICSDKGLPVLIEIIRTASAVGSGEDWFELLLSKICLEESYLSPLFSKLSLCDDSMLKSDLFGPEQAFLLSSLSKILNEQISDISIFNDFALSVLGIFKKAAGVVDFTSRGRSGLPTGFPNIDVFGYSLTILRDICACDLNEGKSVDAVESLLSTGFLELLLDLLCDLEPPAIIRKAVRHGKLDEGTSSDSGKCCPYKGFRRDLVAVVGNCAYRRKHVQDWIRENNKLMVLLQQCVTDDDNPFLREWGIWSMRNLLEGNEENQRKVSELEVRGSVDMPELAGLGLKVEVDPKTQRAKLVNVS